MVQYNYFDEDIQAGMEGIEHAASKGLGIFVMEPLKGGILAGKMPAEAEEIFKKANPNKSNAEWALEWVLNNGKLKIPYTTGILIGIGETAEEIADSLIAIRELYDKYGHIQEVIIQNFTPISGIEMENWPEPSFLDMIRTVIAGTLVFSNTNVSIQVPPNLNNYTAQIFLSSKIGRASCRERV